MSTWTESVARNETQQCSFVENRGGHCSAHRYGASEFCGRHWRNKARRGHPAQDKPPISAALWKYYSKMTTVFLRKWGSSEEFRCAIPIAQDILSMSEPPKKIGNKVWISPKAAARGKPNNAEYYAWQELQARPDITPAELLYAILTVYLIVELEPWRFGKGPDVERVALAASVLTLRGINRVTGYKTDRRTGNVNKVTQPPSSNALRYLGQRIMDTLGVWAKHAVDRLRKDQDAEVQRLAKVKRAFPEKPTKREVQQALQKFRRHGPSNKPGRKGPFLPMTDEDKMSARELAQAISKRRAEEEREFLARRARSPEDRLTNRDDATVTPQPDAVSAAFKAYLTKGK